jgi:hypothetical protein
MKKKWNKYRFLILATLITISMMTIYGYNEYNRGMPDTHQLKPSFKLNAEEILKQFEANEAETTIRYTEKTICVRGIVGYTYFTDTSATVFLNGAGALASIICEFQKGSTKEVQNLKTGNTVTIKGICSGYLLDVVMVRCVVDK